MIVSLNNRKYELALQDEIYNEIYNEVYKEVYNEVYKEVYNANLPQINEITQSCKARFKGNYRNINMALHTRNVRIVETANFNG